MKRYRCGCTDDNACWDEEAGQPCHWAEPDLCSVCAKAVYCGDPSCTTCRARGVVPRQATEEARAV
jgi:hypothetical protein